LPIAGATGAKFNIHIYSSRILFRASKQRKSQRLGPLPYPVSSISNHQATIMQIQHQQLASTIPKSFIATTPICHHPTFGIPSRPNNRPNEMAVALKFPHSPKFF
jgi:hypothetical protein